MISVYLLLDSVCSVITQTFKSASEGVLKGVEKLAVKI